MKIEFKNVGRDKRSWTETIEQQPTEAIIERLESVAKAAKKQTVRHDDAGRVFFCLLIGTIQTKFGKERAAEIARAGGFDHLYVNRG